MMLFDVNKSREKRLDRTNNSLRIWEDTLHKLKYGTYENNQQLFKDAKRLGIDVDWASKNVARLRKRKAKLELKLGIRND